MKTIEKILKIKTLAETAREALANENKIMFDKTIGKLIKAEPVIGLMKSDLFSFIKFGNKDSNCKIADDLHYKLDTCGLFQNSTPVTAINSLYKLILFCKFEKIKNDVSIKEIIIGLCNRFIADVRFYVFGMYLFYESVVGT